jgi:predicted Fe-Mo cluster-binding NifX family protein
MGIKFAFALNNDHVFEKRHFGEADIFAIYRHAGNHLKLLEKFQNPHQNMDENAQHGSAQKGLAITKTLKEKEVKVIVSRQFGKNIRIINQNFIPVIIEEKKPEDVIDILEKHLKWLEDELENKSGNYMLFRIKNGIFKSQINPNCPE